MKQKAKRLLLILVLACTMPLLFVACNKKPEPLSKPQISLVNTETEFAVNSTEIANANGYCFEVNGIPFLSKTPTLDLTEIITEYKTYVIKAYAVGSGKFANSKSSNIITYKNNATFETPILNINATTLTWSEITGAECYVLYVNNTAVEISQNQVDIKQNEEIFNLLNLNQNNTFTVKVKETTEIFESEMSNVINYAEVSNLLPPTELKVEMVNNKVVLSWQANYIGLTYNVFMNNELISSTKQKQIDVTSFITDATNYSFKVQAISNNQLVSDSELTEEVVYSNYLKLATPQISDITLDDNYNVTVNWQNIENAISYNVLINATKTVQVFANKLVLTQQEVKELLTEQITFQVMANGYNNYLNSDLSTQKGINPYKNLSAPTNLKVERQNELTYLSFTAIQNATIYVVQIDDITFETDKTYINISEYVTQTTTYSIKIKCKAHNFFKESSFSNVLNYAHSYILSAPTNLSVSVVNSILALSWNAVENAVNYNIKITFDSATFVLTTTSNFYEYAVYSGGVYECSVMAIGDGINYFSSSYTKPQSVSVVRQINSPSNFIFSKDNSYLTLTWSKVANARCYELSYNNKVVNLTNEKLKLELSEFDAGTYVFSLKAIAVESEFYTDSTTSILSYKHGNQTNIGEVFYANGDYHDFFIESYEELVNLISYAKVFNKEKIKFYGNFNYHKDLTDNFYADYVNVIDGYSKSDNSIKNEIISAIISLNATEEMQYVSFSKVDTLFTLKLNFATSKTLKTVDGTNYAVDKQFTPYVNGSRTGGVLSETLETLPTANVVATTDQLLYVINENKKPTFASTVRGSEISEYYNNFVKILNENLSKDASTYKKILTIYDYLTYNTIYDFACQNYITENNVSDYYNYYSYNIDGVAEYGKATSVGLAKTFALLCKMEGINATYNIANENGTIVAYNTVECDGEWYVVDFFKSVFINNQLNNENYQYFTHNYFMNNSSELGYINATTESWPHKQEVTKNVDYFNNYINIGLSSLVVTDEDSLMVIAAYCIVSNRFALEIKYTISEHQLESAIQATIDEGMISDCKIFYHNNKAYIKITL